MIYKITVLTNVQKFSRSIDEQAIKENICNNKNHELHLKVLRLKAIFQIMYFTKNERKKKTPLQVLRGLYVYKYTKSKTLIKILNLLGLSVSYDVVLRIKIQLANYAYKCSEKIILSCQVIYTSIRSLRQPLITLIGTELLSLE